MNTNTTETITSFLEKILNSVHPLMREALCLAAVPGWYNTALLATMRQRDDGREEGLVTRLARYSFIVPLQLAGGEDTNYTVRPEERIFLQRYWIAKDSAAYLDAHRRAFAYWTANPEPNIFAHTENLLYHQLFVDIQAGMDYLVDRFRTYHNERQLTAIEHLLDTVAAARFFLAMLSSESLDQLDDLLTHLRARLAQLRGQWDVSLDSLQSLRQKSTLAPWLLPYVARAYGYALAYTGQHVEAIDQYSVALDLFNHSATTLSDSASIQSERAHTMIAIGDAYVDLAVTIRGYQERIRPETGRWHRIRDFFYFFLSLPLVAYLGFHLGRRVWHPRFWHLLNNLDWIVARLFATGAKSYAQADPILERYGTPAEGVAADEQLAYLYLSMGDMEQAQLLFTRLLSEAEAPLGEYRQASTRLGLGQALLGLGYCESAREQFELALPVLALYEDRAGQAEAERFLGEAMLETGEPIEAVNHMNQALRYYQAQENESLVTELAEQLAQLAKDDSLQVNQQEAAAEVTRQVEQRCFPVRYRHPATIFFQRATLGLLAIAVFLILASSIRIETGIAVAPEITFQASPLLQHNAPDFKPDLSQGVAALKLTTVADPELLLWLAVLLFLAYLFLSTGIGIIAISGTSLAKVQAEAEAETVRFDDQQLQVGPKGTRQTIRLAEVTRFDQADMFFVKHLMVDDSATTLHSPSQRLVINARTAWYEALRQRISRQLPATSTQVDISFSMIRSRLGIWYLVTIGALLLLSLLGRFAPPLLVRDLPGLFYSLTDIFPFLYLGLLVPPFWWFVIWPLRMRLRNDPASRLPWWIGGAGLVLAVLRVLTRFIPWFTIPDIYVPLLILMLVHSAAITIWQARLPQAVGPLYAGRLRLAVVGLAVAVSIISALDLGRELGSYHYLVQGNAWRDQTLQQEIPADSTARRAIQAYNRAIQISGFRVLGMERAVEIDFPGSIPTARNFVWISALESRAAMYSRRGEYGSAIDDYTRLLKLLKEPADIYAERAMAYLRLAAVTNAAPGPGEEVDQIYQHALADFDQAIEHDLSNARYRLWRGVAHHALGDKSEALSSYQTALGIKGKNELDANGQAKAWTGLGWLAYARGEYRQAVSWFQTAVDIDINSAEARLGLGYAYYSLRQYDDSLRVWGEAAELDPSNPTIFISLGTLYWRVATLGNDYNARGTDRCSSSSLSDADKRQSAAQLEKAIENFSLAAAIPGQDPEDVAFTYRTIAQIQFLLRNCPGFGQVEVLEEAISSYTEAVRLDPENAVYWQMRGRLSYSLWFNTPAGSGPAAREILFAGLNDLNKALELDPVDNVDADYRPNHYRRIVLAQAVDGTLSQGDSRFAAGEFEQAFAYYELVAREQPDHSLAAFKAGLASLAAGNRERALTWYNQGLERAVAAADKNAVQIAWLEYQALISSQGVEESAIDLLFDDYGLKPGQPEDAVTAFTLALIAVQTEALQDQAASLYELGIELASAAEDMDLVKSAAAGLQDFALKNPEIDEATIYWPLDQNRDERSAAAAKMARPDLYWRYRAEFGFRFVMELFKQRAGRESVYEAIFDVVKADMAEAYRLNPSDNNRIWRDFFVDANIGWLYLRRGDEFFAEAAYEAALADYVEAIGRIQPRSSNAANDLGDATFRAGLTSLALGELDQARMWYDTGLGLIEQYQAGEAVLERAISDLELLQEQSGELTSAGQTILQKLEAAR